jgi:hypothetical protein
VSLPRPFGGGELGAALGFGVVMEKVGAARAGPLVLRLRLLLRGQMRRT